MTLSWLILIPLVGGALAGLLGRRAGVARGVALVAALLDLVWVIVLWQRHIPGAAGPWLLEERAPWIPRLGVSYHLGLDGLSLLLLALTAVIAVIAVLVSWREIDRRVGAFHCTLLWTIAGINGVFLALDLFLFYFFWEVMLVPMYFLIGVWGHERRIYASLKFFIFTLASGLLMLVSILALYFIHSRMTGVYTFDYQALTGVPLLASTARWLMFGFLAAFLVKLPAVPLHNWLPDAHSQAPTAGSVVLAALLLKTGAYGLIRFVLPFFPEAAREFAPVAMLLGVIGILYGALLAYGQTDLKRLVAYTSVSHMGFVLLGIFSGNRLALQGTVIEMICHGISTGALFVIAGMLYERMHTRDLSRMGGLWPALPRLGGFAMVFVMASLGLPGLGNFVGEILILIGVYRAHATFAVLATIGVVGATIYSLAIMQRVFHGPAAEANRAASPASAGVHLRDLSAREVLVLAVLVVAIVGLGLFPQPVLNAARPALDAMSGWIGAG